ncbi:hypothetical protein [Ruminococcus flavefaciens]|uniref:hypothetical protein n=1 Tax=Ruminococcus flavefaciens TaxID=1265 RepID=UPI00048C5926|nr:hypothetical protein [Ruminococcus flavefaciens]
MREYDKMTLKVAERIFEKGDGILEQRQKKAAKIRHISYAVSGLCAVLIVCFGVWKILPSMKKPDNSFNDSNIVITTEAPTAAKITEAVTNEITTAEKTANAITTVKTTAKSTETAAVIVRTSANAAAPAGTTAVNNTVTRRTTAKATAKITHTTVYTHTTANAVTSTTVWSGEEIAHITTSGVNEIIEVPVTAVTTTVAGQEGSPVTISRTTEKIAPTTPENTQATPVNTRLTAEPVIRPVTTTTSVDIYSDIRGAFKTYPVSVSLDNIRYDRQVNESYPPSSDIGSDLIGGFIRKARVTIYITQKNKIVQTMEVYEVSGRSIEQAVAVRLTDTDEYYLFQNFDYKKEADSS